VSIKSSPTALDGWILEPSDIRLIPEDRRAEIQARLAPYLKSIMVIPQHCYRVAQHLVDIGDTDFKYIEGVYVSFLEAIGNRPPSDHAWVSIGDVVIDLCSELWRKRHVGTKSKSEARSNRYHNTRFYQPAREFSKSEATQELRRRDEYGKTFCAPEDFAEAHARLVARMHEKMGEKP
jgi:hypothetical protein